MEQFLQTLSDAVKAAGATTLTLSACVVLLLALLADRWFGHARLLVRLVIFLILLLADCGILWFSYAPPLPPMNRLGIARSNYVIDLQYRGISQAEATEVMNELKSKGWTVYGVEECGAQHKCDDFRPSIVKYGASSNAIAAEVLYDDVGSLRHRLAPLSYSRDEHIKPTHIELWIGR